MLARRKRLQRERGMQVIGNGDIDRIDVGLLEHGGIVAEHFGNAHACASLASAVETPRR